MSATGKRKLLSFAWPADTLANRIWLAPRSNWELRGGMSPDTNSAVCTAEEYSLLPAAKQGLIGTIELWLDQNPDVDATADVTFALQTLVSVSIDQFGFTAGASTPSVISYQLSFADARHGWVEPRGGRLLRGQVNSDLTTTPDPNATLVSQCATAMGATVSISSSTLNAVEPARDLDWSFAHAPSELCRLLEHTGHAFCPSPSDGFGTIAPMLVGSYPTYPTERVIHNLEFGVVDRRALELIITSAPSAAIRTYDETMSSPPSWKFVAQDPDDYDKWKELASITQIGSTPITALRNGLPAATDEFRTRLLSQMYRCIQVDQAKFPAAHCSILNEVFWPDETRRPSKPSMKLQLAHRQLDGAWSNITARIPVAQVVSEYGVLQFDDRLVKVDGTEAGDLDPFAVAIAESALKPTFSVEAWDATGSQRVSGIWGYSLITAVPTAMSDSAARARLTGYRPSTAVLQFPELVPIRLNDSTDNLTTLATRALSYAKAYLASDSISAREVLLTGFYPIAIGPRVSQVVYDFDKLTTTITVDGWSLPRQARGGRGGATSHGKPRVSDRIDDTSLSKPSTRFGRNADQLHQPRAVRSNTIRERKPVQPVASQPKQPSGMRPALLKVSSRTAAGVYDATVLSSKLSAPSGALSESNLGTASSRSVTLLCTNDAGDSNSRALRSGDIVSGLVGPAIDGQLFAVASGPRDAAFNAFKVQLVKTSGSAGSKTTACSFVYTVKTGDGVITLGTSIAPEWPSRSENGRRFEAVGGLAYFDKTATIKLAIAFERSGTGSC